MNVLIVEDVTLVAERIEYLVRAFLRERVGRVSVSYGLEDALCRLNEDVVDLLLLDLNLNGKDGFELLKHAAARSFKTIVITANRTEAARAFDLGILDFVTKPITEERFNLALGRVESSLAAKDRPVKHLAIKARGRVDLIEISEINFIKAAKNHSEIFLKSKASHLHDKNLNELQKLLPSCFIRIHRSFVTSSANIRRLVNHGAGRYDVELKNGVSIPINRDSYRALTRSNQTSRHQGQ